MLSHLMKIFAHPHEGRLLSYRYGVTFGKVFALCRHLCDMVTTLAVNYFGVPLVSKQLNLFDDNNRSLFKGQEKLVMDSCALIRWKQRIFEYQHSVTNSNSPQQQTLFDLPRPTWHTCDEIEPFSLKLHPADFYRKSEPPEPFDNPDQGCIYFIIDNTLPLLLYVGETKLTATKRWTRTHYCKQYIFNYIELHRRYKLDVAVCSAFWLHVPPDKKILLSWERELILKWRSPFNKECWQWWGQPFGKI